MSRFARVPRPQPAMVVASLSLFIALGGTSYAALSITGRNIKDGSITTKDIKNKTLRAADFNSSVLKGLTGPTGARGPAGQTGATGSPGAAGAAGAAGTALGYARVSSTGAVDQALNVATANVVKPAASTGFYCFTGLSFTPHNAQVTLLEPFPTGETLGIAPRVVVGTPNAGFNCPAGTTALVTIRKDASGAEDHGFYVLFN